MILELHLWLAEIEIWRLQRKEKESMSWFSRDSGPKECGLVEDEDLAAINTLHDRALEFAAVDDNEARQIFNRERNKVTAEVEARTGRKVMYDYQESKFYYHDPNASHQVSKHRKPWNGRW